MKHTKEVTILILVLFLLTQFMGFFIIYNYIRTERVEEKVLEFYITIDKPKEDILHILEIYEGNPPEKNIYNIIP